MSEIMSREYDSEWHRIKPGQYQYRNYQIRKGKDGWTIYTQFRFGSWVKVSEPFRAYNQAKAYLYRKG